MKLKIKVVGVLEVLGDIINHYGKGLTDNSLRN